jgi:EpsI family protein
VQHEREQRSQVKAWRIILVAATFSITALYLSVASRAEELPPRKPFSALSMSIDEWRGRRAPDLTPEVLKLLGADEYIMRSYTSAGKVPLNLYIGYHASQRQGDTIHSPLNCLPGAGWEPMEVSRIQIPVRASAAGEPTPIDVNRVVIAKGLDKALVLYWYQSPRRVVASEYWGKVYTVLDSVRYHRTDAAMVRIVAPLTDDVSPDAVEKQAVAFAQALFPRLSVHLPS